MSAQINDPRVLRLSWCPTADDAGVPVADWVARLKKRLRVFRKDLRLVGTEGAGNWVTTNLPAGMVDLVDLSPGGQRWLVRDAAGRLVLGALQDGQPDKGVVLFDKPVNGVHFSADGRRLLVKRADGVVQVLRATDRPGPVTEQPTDLPAGTAWTDGSLAEAWGGWQLPFVPLAGGVMVLAVLAATGISLRAARRAGVRPQAVA